jgi:phage terminase small subunit
LARLSDKQEQFCREYIVDLNGTQAAIRAGYKENSARQIATENLSKPYIQDRIQQLMNERSKRTDITADRVLQELAKIGFADVKDFLSFRTERTLVDHYEGKPIYGYQNIVELKPSDEVDGTLINEVSLKDGALKFKLHDKMAALDKIGRHLKLFTDKVDVTGNIDATITVSLPEELL